MSDSEIQCAICRVLTKNRGENYHSCCSTCAQAMHTAASSQFPTYDGDGFPKNNFFWQSIFEKVKAQITGQTTVSVVFGERKCRQCNIKNDLGATKCYYCETPNPTDY